MSRASRGNGQDSRIDGKLDIPGLLVWQVATLWQREVRPILDELDLTHAQFVLLNAAVSCGAGATGAAPVTQAQIAEFARTDPVMTSEVLRTLERKGLVSRRAHPDDARARRIVVTGRGASVARAAVRAVERCDRSFFETPCVELQALSRLMRRKKR